MLADMSATVQGLYDSREYPPMSHPATHPAVAGVAAAIAGLPVAAPAVASVLEIGCAAGWNLLPMAMAHPQAEHLGIDFAPQAVAVAKEVAAAAGIGNVVFERADFREWCPGRTFDHVIAHGVYSWVDAPARQILLERCRQALAPAGIACVGFNTLAGWTLRRQVVEVARAVAVTLGDDPSAPLATLDLLERALPEATPHAGYLGWILADMRAKGRRLLPFDDFAPVCDACSLSGFAAAAGAAGLRLLGEATLAGNLPEGVDAGPLSGLEGNPWLLQEACDMLGGRSHRVMVVCRDDAPVADGVTTEVLGGMAVRSLGGGAVRDGGVELVDGAGEPRGAAEGSMAAALFTTLAGYSPACVPVAKLLEALSGKTAATPAQVCGWLFDAARAGLVELRTEPVMPCAMPPERPWLDPLRREAARRRWPLVDALHRPGTLSEEQCRLLMAMDGSRRLEELEALATAHCPGMAFRPWLVHLCERGVVQSEAVPGDAGTAA